MEKKSFKVGDVVMVKAGGPTMTLEEITTKNFICVWFEGNDLYRDGFSKGSLKHVEDKN